jgi:phage-related protein
MLMDAAENKEKPLFWMGRSYDDIMELPAEVRRTFGFALGLAQNGGKFVGAKPLKGFGGAAVLEVVEAFDGDAFRCVYTVKFARAVYVLHVFQKKSTSGIKTPKREIDLVENRLKRALEHYADWSERTT